MQNYAATPDDAPEMEPIVAVFDSKIMAHRTIVELTAAEFDDIWVAVVRGETDDGETTVAHDNGEEFPLFRALVERGWSEEEAHRFDGILPPGTAVMSLRARTKVDHAIRIIQVTGGHIDI
jgi:hypothetical protein